MADENSPQIPLKGQAMSDLEDEKHHLEIAKLKMELRYIRRNFIAQVFNILALVSVGLIVFYFFQRPQIDQMENARVANEKQQVANLLITAQSIEDSNDKRKMIQTLSNIYPQYEFLSQIAQSNIIIAEKPAADLSKTNSPPFSKPTPSPSSTPSVATASPTPPPSEVEKQSEPCTALQNKFDELLQQGHQLRISFDNEKRGLGLTRMAGMGPVAQSLMIQLRAVDAEKARVSIESFSSGCRPPPYTGVQ